LKFIDYRFGDIIIFAVEKNPEKRPIIMATSKSTINNEIDPKVIPAA